MKLRKFAAIDIGSNGIRLLIQNVIEEAAKDTQFIKNSLVRAPVRLGQDTFTVGKITPHSINRMADALNAFKLLMKIHDVEAYQACATSAMREASNAREVAETIYKKTGISIDIIDGKQEASIIAATDLGKLIEKHKTYLYVDVGGGSTEFTIFSEGKIIDSKSFPIGTVRLLNEAAENSYWQDSKEWIRTYAKTYTNLIMIGSGGNINKLFKLSGRKPGQSLSYLWLYSQYQLLRNMTYEERILQVGLNPDRADVILPATHLYLSAAQWSGAKKIYVPKIGLADGIIKRLYLAEKNKEI